MMDPYLNARLIETVKQADVDGLNDVIKDYRASPNAYRLDFDRALCLGAKTGHSEIVRILLRSKADVSFCDRDGRRALHYAAEIGSADIVKKILNAGSPVNVVDANGATALHFAADLGHMEVVLLLLQENAHVNRSKLYTTGETPLHLACKSGRTDIAKVLIARGADVNNTTNKISIRDGAMTPLHLAAKGRHAEVVTLLCSVGVHVNKPDAKGRTPLVLATESGASDIVEILLRYNSDPTLVDEASCTPLHYVAGVPNPTNEHIKTAELLLMSGKSVLLEMRDQEGRSALHYAAMTGNTEVAALLLSINADIDAIDSVKHDTPLNTALAHNRIETAKLLILNGADVNIPDNGLVYPLHNIQGSRSMDKAKVTELLIQHGAQLNVQTNRGYTPLDRCVFYCVIGSSDTMDSLKSLVVAGAHLRPLRRQGENRPHHNSPLCWLTWHNRLKAARFLVNTGWDLTSETWISLPGKTRAADEFLEWVRETAKEPGSLASICRGTIREHLIIVSKDRDISQRIHALPLPTLLKQRLMFMDEVHMFEVED